MNRIVIFEADDQPVEVRLEGETVWLSQLQIAELFNTSTDNISLHLKNIYKDHALEESATTESNPPAPPVFANGLRRSCASIWSRATPSTDND